MLNRKISLITVIIIISLLSLFFYTDKKSKVVSQVGKSLIPDQAISINTFSIIPPQLDGCSCYFSNDSTEFRNGQYIYMNDNAQNAFLKINGILTKFRQDNFKHINKGNVIARYINSNYKMTVEFKDETQRDFEALLKTGTIKLIDKNGRSIKKTFHGECGC